MYDYCDRYIRRTGPHNGCISGTIEKLEAYLKPLADTFDAIVVTGLSGTIPGAIIAYKLNKQLVVLRKDSELGHGMRLEGSLFFSKGTPYIILDDFVSSGATIERIKKAMTAYGHGLDYPECRQVYYRDLV